MSQNTTATSLEEIIQRNAQPPSASKLRPFNGDDWYLFAGVETKTPEIADTGWGNVVLDGLTVGVHRATEEDFVSFQTDFPNAATARMIAEHLAGLDSPSEDEIAKYLERL
jgi:hypothetical protein